jgi:predicted RNA-binding Zn ribbon-like protein
MSISTVVEIINDWGEVPRVGAGNDQRPYPDVELVAEDLGILDTGRLMPTTDELRSVADKLFPVFDTSSDAERVSRVAAVLADTGVRPILDFLDGRAKLLWAVDDSSHAVLASAAIALGQQLADHGPERFGVCSGDRCIDVYVDSSPTAHRRFCSITCQNRARTALYRRRHAGRSGKS